MAYDPQNEAEYLKAAIEWYTRTRTDGREPSVFEIVMERLSKDSSSYNRHSEVFDTQKEMLERWATIKAAPSTAWNYYACFDPNLKPTFYVDSVFVPPTPLAPKVVTKVVTNTVKGKGVVIGILGTFGILALMAKAK